MNGVYGTAVSGLLAFQRALATTAHNVTNVNTDGYSRQRVELVARPAYPTGGAYVGSGVNISTIGRVYDQFLVGQEWQYSSLHSHADAYYRYAIQADNLLADPKAGLTPGLEGFFNSLHLVADNASGTVARQALLSEADTLVNRLHYLDRRLEDMTNQVHMEMRVTVQEINSMAKSIGQLNDEIAIALGMAGGSPPNDLLDRRDFLVKQLSEKVSVTTVMQDDGKLNVFIGQGLSLVAGGHVGELVVARDEFDLGRLEISMTGLAATSNVSSQISGGSLGGMLDFRREILDPARHNLGLVTIGLANAVNEQHRLGMDLNGELGQDLFAAPEARVLQSGGNSVGADVTVTVNNVSELVATDYLLRRDGADWTLTRRSDGASWTMPDPASFSVDGLTIEPTGLAGDAFLVRPTYQAAADIGVNITDPARVAAASPLRTGEQTDPTGLPTNTGTGRISAGAFVERTGDTMLAAPITLTYDAGAQQFNGSDGSVIPYDPAANEGDTVSLTIPSMGVFEFQFFGVPNDGDEFVVAANSNGLSDNRNILAIAELQEKRVMKGGSTSFQGAYGEMTADIGIRTHKAEINNQAYGVLLDQAVAARESVSGVNLDEEAANMIRFQQAYQAAAQVINVTNTLFDTLLAAIRR